MDFIDEDIIKARNKYNEIVEHNIKALYENKEDKLKDPDKHSNYDDKIKPSGLIISLSQDGICSFSKIKKFSNGDVIKNYMLLRKDMFDCLCWPAYAMSINQMRRAKFNDRLDMLFMDLCIFYDIVSDNTEISEETIKKIWENCGLARAYIFPYTFYWLRSFGDFKNFIDRRKLNAFLEEKDSRPIVWEDSGKGFDQKYFDKLIEKVKQYKMVM